MPSKPNMIASLRGKHDPHYKLAGRVEGLEKDLPRQLNQLHKTLSKSFGMQRKTLMRVLGLEKKVAELEAQQAAEEQAKEGIDDLLGDILGEDGQEDQQEEVGDTKPKKKKPAAKKKKRPATPVGKKIPQKKKPKIRAKKKKIKAKDLGYSSRVFGKDQSGDYLSPEERKKRFKLGDNQSVGNLSTDVTPEDEAGSGKGTTGLLAPLQAINSSLDNINRSFTEGAKDDKKAADDARKTDEKKKRKGAEGALEKIGGVAVKGVQAVLKPAMGIFQRIWDFLKTVLLGRVVMNVFDYFAKNQDKLVTLFKFVKDWWPVMVAGILAIFGPILGPGAWVVGIGALIWWSVNRITALVKAVGNLFGNIWKFIMGGNKDGDKAEAAALKDIDKETKGMEEPDLSKGKSPPSGDTAKLDKGQDAVDASQKLKAPQESGDEPVKMNKGGQVPGQGNTDTVPAMLTPGEFVMSKGAVQQYGTQTLEGMNAAAGGTNKPTMGGGKGMNLNVPRSSGGFANITNVDTTSSSNVSNSSSNLSNSSSNVSNSSSNLSNSSSNVSNSISNFNGGGLVSNLSNSISNFNGGGLVGRIKGSVKNISGRVRKAINPPVRHEHPVTVSYDNALLQQQRPLGEPPRQDLPSFDAGAMVSMSKIKTLGISV